ncbi:Bestrophin, RFP-TM, chloride channel-domain-containing protein [Obelidium mucronatum]|nr:Bestrophin, RFP-TM, chloride channel-domain-containing protein [Obelidium mucronatum]
MTTAALPEQVPVSARHSINNHHSEHWIDVLRIQVSIIPSIFYLLVVVSLWSALVCIFTLVPAVNFLNGLPPYNAGYTTVVGVVLSLLLGFRLNTAYDRFWEGRKIWSSIHFHTFNLARLIRVTVKTSTELEEETQQSAIKLLSGFSHAVKHRLREEYHAVYPDLVPHIDHMPKVIRKSPSMLTASSKSSHNHPPITKNIPLDILTHIQAYLNSHGQTAPPLCNTISALVEQFTQLERIESTPLPAAYSITLRQVMFLYLIAIPFQLVPVLKWFAIPVTFFAAFVMMGVFEISVKIENPFGYYLHDLPVDSYCTAIQRSLEHAGRFERTGVDRDLKWGNTYGIHESNFRVDHGGVANSVAHIEKKEFANRKRRAFFSRMRD